MDTGYFHVLAFINTASMNIGVHVSFQIRVILIYMPRNGIAGSYGKGILLGRKAMTNLDSILKSRDITLLTKSVVKAIVFPAVIMDVSVGT